MDDPRLLTLLTLVKVKSYTNTAKELFITQPAVTHHIKSLEHEFDIKIFYPGKDFKLTRQGAILIEYARRMINQSVQLTEAISSSLSQTKALRIGVTNNCTQLFAKKNLLSRILKFYNNEMNILVMSSEVIFEELKEGKLDFAIIDNNYDDDLFDGFVIDSYDIVPVCYKEGKFKEIRRITREMLKNNPIILGAKEEGMASATIKALKEANIVLSPTYFNNSNSAFVMSQIIEAKDGIGFMYDAHTSYMFNIKKMDLLNFKVSQNVYLLYSQNSFDKPTLKSLVKDLKKWKTE